MLFETSLILTAVIWYIVANSKTKTPDLPEEKAKSSTEYDPKYQELLDCLRRGKNIFITGGAGTGKSYMLGKLKQKYGSLLYMTSTTGVSAINIGGQTIHSWSGIGICKASIKDLVDRVKRNLALYRQLLMCRMLAIDEISMLHSDTMDYLNEFLKNIRENDRPFGGIQVILVGDFFQLPPVVSEQLQAKDFCFNSRAWKELDPKVILLMDVKRTTDLAFINILNKMRLGVVDKNAMMQIWQKEQDTKQYVRADQTTLRLFSTNNKANEHNQTCLNALDGKLEILTADERIDWLSSEELIICSQTINESDRQNTWWKNFDSDCKAPMQLRLKQGCRVMLLKNLDVSNGLANGSCGTVTKICPCGIEVLFDNAGKHFIEKVEFELSRTKSEKVRDPEGHEVMADKQRIVRKQYPLCLAYGITIHKSQGMSFDKLIVDCDRIFAEGQAYVAMSRTRSFQGLYTINFDPSKVVANKIVAEFYQNFQSATSEENLAPKTINSDIFDTLKEAVQNNKRVQIKYKSSQDFHDGKVTQRVVKPLALDYGEQLNKQNPNTAFALGKQSIYLKGFCELRQEERTFLLDRIIEAKIINHENK